MAADALSIIPIAVLRNLSDKLYEKRKNAAPRWGGLFLAKLRFPSNPSDLEVEFFLWWGLVQIEGIVKQLATAGEHEKISAVIQLITNDFTFSPQANHRKVLPESQRPCF
jgi:vacuole morphology and inheritance protein 14